MENFKSYQSTGLIGPKSLADKTKLHRQTTNVIIYDGGHYIEMLTDGKFLYRPTGIGRGRRSKNLQKIEKFMYSVVSSKTQNR